MTEREQGLTHLTSFEFEGVRQPVNFLSSSLVVEGVECDVYEFVGDKTKDLGIIRVKPGFRTPVQRVLKGEMTVEGYVAGKGKLTVKRGDGKTERFFVGGNEGPISAKVEVGDLMQWEADKDTGLTAFELCIPAYDDGRFENLAQPEI